MVREIAFHPTLPILLLHTTKNNEEYIEMYQRLEKWDLQYNKFNYELSLYKSYKLSDIIQNCPKEVPIMEVHHILNIVVFTFPSGFIDVFQLYDRLIETFADELITSTLPMSVEYYLEGQKEDTTAPLIMPPISFQIVHKEDFYVYTSNFIIGKLLKLFLYNEG